MNSEDDGELEFIGKFEKPPPNILAEITLLDDDDEENNEKSGRQVRVEVESDSDISIIEINPLSPENGPNSFVKKMSSHQKQSQNQSNANTNSQQLNINTSEDHYYNPPPIVDDVSNIVIDGEQNDNNELVGSKSKEKNKRKKPKKSSSNEKESNGDAVNEGVVEENEKKKSKKKKRKEKSEDRHHNLDSEPLSLRDPVFVGKVLHVIPVPSIAFDSTHNFYNQNASVIDNDDNCISTKGRRNTKDANINVNDNLVRKNGIFSSNCQRSVSSLDVPVSESENISGAGSLRAMCLNCGGKSFSGLYENKCNRCKFTRYGHPVEVFPPEAQSMNRFIKRLGISHDHKISDKSSATLTLDEIAKNDAGKVKSRKRKRSTSKGDDETEVITPITDTDVNPNKTQAFNSRLDKNPIVKEHIELEDLIKHFSNDNEKISAPMKDCSEKNDSILMGPPPSKNVPIQNLIASSSTSSSTSSLTEENPSPWDPIIIRTISNNNRLGLPNSWTQEMMDFYAKPYDEDFDLKCVFRSMTDNPRFWAAPCENNRYRNRTRYMYCRICNEKNQHETRFCPDRGKLPVCTNCGLRGHTVNGDKRTSPCLRAMCLNCGLKSFSGLYENNCNRCKFTRYGHPVSCALCGMKGHVEQVCPDQWRRYHSTTIPLAKELLDKIPTADDLKGNVREIGTNKTNYKIEQNCCNCSRPNHNYFHCQKSLYSEYTPNKPFIIVDLPTSTPAKMDLIENEMCQDQDKNSQQQEECESAVSNQNDKVENKQDDEQEVIILDSSPIPNKIRKLDSSGPLSNSNNESRLCPSLSVSYEISTTPSTLYASGYSKKHLEIIYSADLSKTKSHVEVDDTEPEPEPNITNLNLSHLTNNSSKSKQHSRSDSESDEERSSKRRDPDYSPIKRVRNDRDRNSSSSSKRRRSNGRYFAASYKNFENWYPSYR